MLHERLNYPTSCDQPFKLDQAQIDNPYLAIDEFFDFDSLPHLRNRLFDFLKVMITGSYSSELIKRERVQLIYFYESLEKLIEAAFLINESKKRDLEITSTEIKKNSSPIPVLPTVDSPRLKEIIQLVVEAIDPDKIYLTNTRNSDLPEKTEYSLLILIPGNTTKSFEELIKAIEIASSAFPNLFVYIRKVSDVYPLLVKGHIFYSVACTPEKLLYDSNKTQLPNTAQIPYEELRSAAAKSFHNSFLQTASFLDGAKQFMSTKQNALAAFMLQQTAEHSLRSVISALMGQNIITHNLRKLLRYTTHCTPDLIAIFPFDNETDRALLTKLEQSYVQARYTEEYTISDEELSSLLELVEYLRTEAQRVCTEKIDLFKPY